MPRILTHLSHFLICLLALAHSAAVFSTNAADLTLKDAYKDDFRVGVAVNRTITQGQPVNADNVKRTLEQVKNDIDVVVAQFNQISPENDLKWALIHPEEGPDGYNWGPADDYVEFGLRHNLLIVGHTLVWHGQTPRWVFHGDNPPPPDEQTAASGQNAPAVGRPGRASNRFAYTGPRASREELLQRMSDHIHAVVGRYKGKIQIWDVVNEAVADSGPDQLRNSLWLQIIGPDFIAKAFHFAHEADPDAILRYNDFGLENPAKRRKFIDLIKSLQDDGVPISAIGTQTHVSATSPTFEQIDGELTDLETLGLPIHITELDVNVSLRGQRSNSADISDNNSVTGGAVVERADQQQADQYANLFKAFLKHKSSVKVVTLWGLNDAVSWRANGKPLLFDGDDQPKPAFDAVIHTADEQSQSP
jgi:endo-1,4-beta-xylanase